jgi:hypothetical protein
VEGEVRPLVEKNIRPSPGNPDHYFWTALLMVAAGIGLILAIELILAKKPLKSNVNPGS